MVVSRFKLRTCIILASVGGGKVGIEVLAFACVSSASDILSVILLHRSRNANGFMVSLSKQRVVGLYY